MGCKGSKQAEAPKSESASSTLLTEPEESKGEAPATQASALETTPKEVAANAPAEKIERSPNEAPATKGSDPETAAKEVAANATARNAEEPPKEAPSDAITAKAEEAMETQGALKSGPDATVTKIEEVKSKEAATEEASATGLPAQASNDEITTALEEAPIAADKMVSEKVAETDAASKAEVTESAVSVAAADAAVAGKQGGCFSYCTATEAETQLVVQN